MSKKLSEIKTGNIVKIVRISSSLENKISLTSFGLLPGDQLEVLRKSLFGSPISYKHGEANFFALRKSEAEQIEVE